MGPHSVRLLVMVACAIQASACGASVTDPASQQPPLTVGHVALTEVVQVSGMPVYLTAPPSDPRLFIVERAGRIRVVEDGQLLAAPFLDITDSVSGGGEQGLLSLAFHPDYATTGYLYVYYTDVAGDSRIVRYQVSADRNVAAPGSAKVILTVSQPYPNHNGGLLVFGPGDMLFIGLGDGGSGGDPQNNGQDPSTLLGSLLRIDVDRGDPYAIPQDNPFVGGADWREETWAYGLRNPWRFSFDDTAGMLYVADVGQNSREEVNATSAATGGLNYGWRIMEGSSCFNSQDCTSNGLVLPVLEYVNGVDGCAVVGGYVYRGVELSSLGGTYFYSDNCAGWIRSFRLESGTATEQKEWDVGDIGNVLSFGVDGFGELYVLSANRRVYRFDSVR
jgi:glucose/arabinose dehydrogenase